MLYPLFYLLIILHGIEGILQQPRFHLYLIVPGKLQIQSQAIVHVDRAVSQYSATIL